MDLTMSSIEDHIQNWQPGLSIDCVIMGYANHELHVLLLKWKNSDRWSLPGGFIEKEEDLDDAALRILSERTGVTLPTLHQFHTFGGRQRRDPDDVLEVLSSLELKNPVVENWLMQRFVSVGYLSLINMNTSHPKADFLSDRCEWILLRDVPELIFDHNEMIEKALEFLRIRLRYLPVGRSLLPQKFTMKDLQRLYETILNKSLDRANFQKSFLKLNVLVRHEKQMLGGAHKAPFLYSFDKVRYDEYMKRGLGFTLS